MLDPVRLPVYTVVLPLYLQPPGSTPRCPGGERVEGLEGLVAALIRKSQCPVFHSSDLHISTSVSNSQFSICLH